MCPTCGKLSSVNQVTSSRCDWGVKWGVKGVKAVEKADVSLSPGTAAVAFDAQKINVAQIKSAIREAGFEAA